VAELSLFNKVGDLYIKVSRVPEAVEAYERAANLYAESGFPNNAIALCNKVLRNAPGRTHIYLKLAMLMVERGFVAEAKQNLLEYADRMQKAGKTDEAFRALKEFADLSPDNEEIRLLLAEQLKGAARTAEAREQLAKLFHEAEASGDHRRSRATLSQIRAIDPDFDPTKAPKPRLKERRAKSSELVFLDLDEEYGTRLGAAAGVEEEPSAVVDEGLGMVLDAPPDEDLDVTPAPEPGLIIPDRPIDTEALETPRLDIESTVLDDVEAAELPTSSIEGLDLQREFDVEDVADEPTSIEVERGWDTDDAAAEGGEIEAPDLDVEEAEPILEFQIDPAGGDAAAIEVPDLDLGEWDVSEETEVAERPAASAPDDQPVSALEMPPPEPEREVVEVVVTTAPDLHALEAAVADDPDDPARHVALGEALLETGDRERGLEELDIALRVHEGRDEWNRAAGMADEIVRLEPNSVRHHQKRVELAYRTGEKGRLVESYLGLGDALVRTGVLERARLVYQRVLEHEPNSAHAREAIANLEPAVEAAPPAAAAPQAQAVAPTDYVDLGALILEDEPSRDTRMRVQDEEPTGDEERDFQEMLAQFKRGIEANIEDEDWQAHYDLGVAFKEMGLLDEAIAEFQKALRAPAGRLRTAEALGGCFYEKGQFSVAGTVMRRAVETDPTSDDAKIGLLYWMGRCEEQMSRSSDALAHYQRVFALDIQFRDVQDRVKRLTAAAK
jgi:tetratricopeptide (TPR) repeat protein